MSINVYKYIDQNGEHTITRVEILDQYYTYWCEQMLRVHRAPMITPENCIDDFCVIHWAAPAEDWK